MKTQKNKDWYEGFYGEWIFVYHPERKLLLMTYGYGDCSNIYERIIVDDTAEEVLARAEMRVTYIDEDDVEQAVTNLALKNWAYGFVQMDWRNKDAVNELINS